jgi:ubiquinone/menaquinone biosynthesis C-methylase UbiE
LEDFWARHIKPSGQLGSDYWNYFAERIVDLATIPEDAAVLDIGTYDGNVLFKAMKKAGPRGYGIGVDIYSGGLKDRLTEGMGSELGPVIFAQMDAASLGFLPEIYDSVLANFVGWDYCFDFDRMEFTAFDCRMAEIMRVLKPGGQVGIGFWIEQCDIEWIAEAFKRYLPEYEEATVKRISSYAKENPKGYKAILRSSGFNNISVHVETTTFISPDEATWWQQMKQAASDYFEKITDPAELQWFKEKVLEDLQQFRSSIGIQFDKTVSYAFGTKL